MLTILDENVLNRPLDRKEDCPASSLRIFGNPLIVHNILIAQNMLGIDTVTRFLVLPH